MNRQFHLAITALFVLTGLTYETKAQSEDDTSSEAPAASEPAPASPNVTRGEWKFSSDWDHFTVRFDGDFYSLGGKKISSPVFKDIKELMALKLGAECTGQDRKPDLSIEQVGGGKTIKRNFFMKSAFMTDGKECAQILSDGLFYLPLDRKWFTGDKKTSLPIGDSLTVKKGGEVLFAMKRVKSKWEEDSGYHVNMDFFENFIRSIESFEVDRRVHVAASNNKPKFIVSSGTKVYEFYELAPALWAVKKDEVPYLLSSKEWSSWGSFESSVWRDSWSGTLEILCDHTQPYEKRMSSLASLQEVWSRSVAACFSKIMTDPNEDLDVKKQIAVIVRTRPTYENYRLLSKGLKATQDKSLQTEIVKIVRILNPKGPLIQSDDSESERERKINYWIDWYKKPSPKP